MENEPPDDAVSVDSGHSTKDVLNSNNLDVNVNGKMMLKEK